MITKYSHARQILAPGQTNDLIPVELISTTPVPTVVKKPPVMIPQNVVVVQDNDTEDAKEVDARNFPTLRGFA